MAAKLKYEASWYTPAGLKDKLDSSIGEAAQIRKEYSRLRDIAMKRIKRMSATRFAETNIYKRNYRHYPKLKDIKSNAELAGRLADLAEFIKSPYSTVSKQKSIMQKSLTTLHEHHYNFVNEDNFIDFGKFMEEYRDQHLDEIYDSGDAADAYGVVVKHQLDPEKVKEDFEFWLENINAAKELRRSKQSLGNYDKIKARTIKKGKQNGNKTS